MFSNKIASPRYSRPQGVFSCSSKGFYHFWGVSGKHTFRLFPFLFIINILVEFLKDFLELQIYISCMYHNLFCKVVGIILTTKGNAHGGDSLSSLETWKNGEWYCPSCDICILLLSCVQPVSALSAFRSFLTDHIKIFLDFGPYCIAYCATCLQSQ